MILLFDNFQLTRTSMGVGWLSDWVVLILARRNNGYKEPEMRLWAYLFPFIFGAIGYFTYGWAATNGDHWIAIAVALCCLIAQQVSLTSMATAYAMECFDGVGRSCGRVRILFLSSS